jgi:hypothetical protein
MTPLLASGPVRMFRLSNEPGERGLSCTPDGVTLAGIPLIRNTPTGFVPRPPDEIASLRKAAYGDRSMALPSRLGAIAKALNSGDFASAMIAAVHTQTPELDADAAMRLAQADDRLTKYDYNPEEPRDRRGRWTAGGSNAPTDLTALPDDDYRAGGVDDRPQRVAENTFPAGTSLSDATGSSHGGAPGDRDDSSKPLASEEKFERKYDDLGPEEFSKEVIKFGYWLETHGRELSPADKEQALAEYAFLQTRLSIWLNYDYKSALEHGYLVSAATRLYQGATNSGLVPVGRLPASMLDAAGMLALYDNPPPLRPRPATKPAAEEPASELPKAPENVEFGAIVDREATGITWGKGIREQGLGDGNAGWEKYVASATLLRSGSTGFDLFDSTTGEATSAKTLNTGTTPKINRPQKIYDELRGYIDDVLDYEPTRSFDIDPDLIKSKTIQLAIPEQTLPNQWRQLLRAIIYGKDNGVKVVITVIRG